MRILYHHRTQARDGQAVHIRALQQAFRQLGHVVQEVGLVDQGGDEGGAEGGAPGRSRWSWIARLPGVLLELAEYGYGAVARGKILRAAAHFEPDLIYERYAFGNTGGVQAARRLGLPLVLEVNSPMVLELSRTRGLKLEGLARKVERFIFREASLVCAVTGVLRDMLVQEGVEQRRLLVTPNGVDLERYAHADPEAARAGARAALGLPPEDRDPLGGAVLGFVGYYRDWHRLDVAIEALTDPALVGARLVLIGEGPAHDDLAERARQLGVSERVVFAGARPHDRIPDLLPAFDVALIPAINPYASPLKLHEYMAAELAVLAPRQPNLLEVLEPGRNAQLFAPDDPDGLRQGLLELVADPHRARELGRQGRATIVERDLTWRGNARRVVRAVEALP